MRVHTDAHTEHSKKPSITLINIDTVHNATSFCWSLFRWWCCYGAELLHKSWQAHALYIRRQWFRQLWNLASYRGPFRAFPKWEFEGWRHTLDCFTHLLVGWYLSSSRESSWKTEYLRHCRYTYNTNGISQPSSTLEWNCCNVQTLKSWNFFLFAINHPDSVDKCV